MAPPIARTPPVPPSFVVNGLVAAPPASVGVSKGCLTPGRPGIGGCLTPGSYTPGYPSNGVSTPSKPLTPGRPGQWATPRMQGGGPPPPCLTPPAGAGVPPSAMPGAAVGYSPRAPVVAVNAHPTAGNAVLVPNGGSPRPHLASIPSAANVGAVHRSYSISAPMPLEAMPRLPSKQVMRSNSVERPIATVAAAPWSGVLAPCLAQPCAGAVASGCDARVCAVPAGAVQAGAPPPRSALCPGDTSHIQRPPSPCPATGPVASVVRCSSAESPGRRRDARVRSNSADSIGARERTGSAGVVGRLFQRACSTRESLQRRLIMRAGFGDPQEQSIADADAYLAAALETADGLGKPQVYTDSAWDAAEAIGGATTGASASCSGCTKTSALGRSTADTSVGSSCDRKSSTSAARRHDRLYHEHEMRQRRILARLRERRTQEAEVLRKELQASQARRPFNKKGFKSWYENQMGNHGHSEQLRRHMQVEQARDRAKAELADCTFEPRTDWRKRSPSRRRVGDSICTSNSQGNGLSPAPATGISSSVASPRGASCGAAEADKEACQQEQTIGDELVAAQILQMEALRQLDEREKQLRAVARREAAENLQRALAENRARVEQVAETDEGRELLRNRAQEYMELNEGLSMSVAMEEAREDLLHANDGTIRQQAIASLRERVQVDSQLVRLERLNIVVELSRLQQTYEELLAGGTLSDATLQGFDASLAGKLQQEPWYDQARESALTILRKEAEIAADRAAVDNAVKRSKSGRLTPARRP